MVVQQAAMDNGDKEGLDEMPNTRLQKEATITVVQSKEIPAAPSGPAASGPVRREKGRQRHHEYLNEVRDT